MATINPFEIGLVIWAETTAIETLRQVSNFGLNVIQLGIPPSIECSVAIHDWKAALADSQVVITSAVCSYAGEDYSNFVTVHESVGFTTEKYRAERIARTKEISAFAHKLGIRAVSCHIGFIPSNSTETLYTELVEVARTLCDATARVSQDFVLETGQESADVLSSFMKDVDRTNLKINFDPANIVLYGSGDPLSALAALKEHVLSVHCKDGRSPVAGTGELGTECVLGDGEVDFPGFLNLLKQIGYEGPLTIEREEPDLIQKEADIRTAIKRLQIWKSSLQL